MRQKIVTMLGEYAGRQYKAKTEAMVCPECRYTTLRSGQFDGYRTKLADAYRAEQGLLTSQQIRETRNRLGMSQEEFADYLGVGVASVKRWELGKSQDSSMDELIRIKSSYARAEQNLLDVLRHYGGEADEFSGGQVFSLAKLANTILFFLHKANEERKRLGPLHINKLCWYADAENYRRNGVSITGSRYARLPYGPALDGYGMIFRELQRAGIIAAKGVNELVPLQALREEEFSPEEIDSLNRTWTKFRNKLRSIVSESHQERAWKKTEHAQLISLRLAK
jgi:putative zinc finger/helix-turn-helix YgiT family protein